LCADDLTETEWTTCALPGTNLPGFTLWHMVRGRDWAVQTAIRGVPEVIAGLLGQPIWRLLIEPCSGHMREHLGELDVLKQVMRGGMSQV
jgi:hypothetical protein